MRSSFLRRCRAPPRASAPAAASATSAEGSINAYARYVKIHTLSLESAALYVHDCCALAHPLSVHAAERLTRCVIFGSRESLPAPMFSMYVWRRMGFVRGSANGMAPLDLKEAAQRLRMHGNFAQALPCASRSTNLRNFI